uniref:Uncharacterized protein n=1 Tax=Panagrellus redivivus TaxID=6233 RepID=A0A7E4W2G7_PANRE
MYFAADGPAEARRRLSRPDARLLPHPSACYMTKARAASLWRRRSGDSSQPVPPAAVSPPHRRNSRLAAVGSQSRGGGGSVVALAQQHAGVAPCDAVVSPCCPWLYLSTDWTDHRCRRRSSCLRKNTD